MTPSQDSNSDRALTSEDSSARVAIVDPPLFEPVSTLFARISALVVVVIALVTLLREGSAGEGWDKDIYVFSVLGTIGLTLFWRWSRRANPSRSLVYVTIAIVGIAVGIGVVEQPDLTTTNNVFGQAFWCGFGLSVLLVAGIISPMFWKIISWRSIPRPLRGLISAGAVLVCITDLLSMVRTPSYIADVTDNSYIINELLAPAAGRAPDANLIPKYDVLYGWLIKPFTALLSPGALVNLTITLLSVMGVAAVLLGVYVAHRALDRRSLSVAALLVVPVTCVSALHGSAVEGYISAQLQELPIRILPGIALFALGIGDLLRLQSRTARPARLIALGAFAGLVAWNSQDFGLAAVVVFSALVIVLAPSPRWKAKGVISWAIGVVLGFVIYPGALAINGTPITVSYVGYFERAFGSGFGAFPIQVPGPVLFVLPVILATAAVGWMMLGRGGDFAVPAGNSLDRAAITAAFFGSWACLGFLYYLNRSFASGQLQVLLLPSAIGLAALCSLAAGSLDALALRPSRWRPSQIWEPRYLRYLRLLPVALAGSLCFGAMLQSPNPKLEITNLVTPPPQQGYPTASIQGSLSDIAAMELYARSSGGQLSYFGPGGNYIQIVTGIPSVSLFDYPDDSIESQTGLALECGYLQAHGTKWLVVSDQTVGTPFDPDVCRSYQPVQIPGVRPGVVEERTSNP